MRWKTQWIPLTLLLLAACEANPVSPDHARPVANVVAQNQVIVRTTSPSVTGARLLRLEADGLYDGQRRQIMSLERVRRLHVDRAFELHRQAKLAWLKERGRSAAPKRSISSDRFAPDLRGISQSPTPTITPRLLDPRGPSLAVAADDPCFFDATVWCSGEEGGELGPLGTGGGSGGTGGDSGGYVDDGTLGCANILSNMNNAYRLYLQTMSQYMELAGSAASGDGLIASSYMDATLQAVYSKMMSYQADYNTWRSLAIKYHCL